MLSAVIRTGERFGAVHISNVLRGAANKQVRSWGHDQLSVYGIAREYSDDELRQSIDALLGQGLLAKDGGSYPTLAVTPSGRMFLKSGDKLTLNRPKIDHRSPKVAPSAALDYDRELFEKLRALRKTIADEQQAPAFVIFGDKVLQEMAYYSPRNKEEFSKISGVGTAKLEHFSEAFLGVIDGHGGVRRAGHDQVVHRNGKDKVWGNGPNTTQLTTKELAGQGLSVEEIAEARGLSRNTIIDHLEKLVLASEDLQLDHLMPQGEKKDKIEAAFKQSGGLLLASVKEILGEEYSYEELKLVRLGLIREGLVAPNRVLADP